MTKFDERCMEITERLHELSSWKHIFFGAAYTTRLKELRTALVALDQYIKQTIDDDENHVLI